MSVTADFSDTQVASGTETSSDPFDEIDFGSFFDEYLDPGHKSPASESVEKPSFETFLSQPQTLPDHLRSQLSVTLISDSLRDIAESIIGNLDEDGYLMASLDEIAAMSGHPREEMDVALRAVQSLEPAGVGARDLRECLLLQLESRNAKDSVAWLIVSKHLRLLETRQFRELAKAMGRPQEHVEIAVNLIKHLNPRPGIRYSGPGARSVEPDVYFIKDGDDYLIQMNDEEASTASSESRLPPHAGSAKRIAERGSRLRSGALHICDSADEEYRAAQTDDPASLRCNQAPPN